MRGRRSIATVAAIGVAAQLARDRRRRAAQTPGDNAHRLAAGPALGELLGDYEAFILAGIPSGGLFSGAEEIKTPEQEAIWGGTAGEQFDPCYHEACDTIDNVDLHALEVNSDLIAFAQLKYAYSTEAVNGVPGKPARTASAPVWRFSYLSRRRPVARHARAQALLDASLVLTQCCPHAIAQATGSGSSLVDTSGCARLCLCITFRSAEPRGACAGHPMRKPGTAGDRMLASRPRAEAAAPDAAALSAGLRLPKEPP